MKSQLLNKADNASKSVVKEDESLKIKFMIKACLQMTSDKHDTFVTAQALCVMFLVNSNSFKTLCVSFYLCLASQIMTHDENQEHINWDA